MKEPELPDGEVCRVTTLRSLNILDTMPEERFDRLTRLAKHMFDVPIALVSLVDSDRQWFKSSVGLDAEQTSRSISFCGHTILDDKILIVPDALEDPRFFDNPLVTGEPHIRFYAGCPIRHSNGCRLGTLCIIDQKPKVLSDDDLEAFRDLADLTEKEIAAAQLATLDDLTEISNRRGFILLARQSLEFCKRHQFSVSTVFLDLNKFKCINDTYGHCEGDEALKTFASLMGQAFRDSDVIARIGGDEFVALLTNIPEETVNAVIVRLQSLVDDYNATANKGYDLSFSYGVVTQHVADDIVVERLLDSADKVMYSNKG